MTTGFTTDLWICRLGSDTTCAGSLETLQPYKRCIAGAARQSAAAPFFKELRELSMNFMHSFSHFSGVRGSCTDFPPTGSIPCWVTGILAISSHQRHYQHVPIHFVRLWKDSSNMLKWFPWPSKTLPSYTYRKTLGRQFKYDEMVSLAIEDTTIMYLPIL